jgi:3-phenylpropionate/trans-cinnamate dioxygenase ferredoxin subunit
LGRYVAAVKLSSLQEGSMVAADVEGNHILISMIGGQVYAVSGVCTHQETDLANGFVIEERVVCPLHLSQFDMRTGQVLNPPATEPLRSFKVKIEDGTVFVEV